MATKSNAVSNAEKNELSITRILNAPRELVFEVWSTPNHIANWWGPNGFTNTIHKMDFVPGGEWNFIMHGPDGTNYINKIVFNDIIKPELISYTHVTTPKFKVNVTFKKYGDKTKLNMHMMFENTQAYNMAMNTFGAKEGLNQTANRLADYLGKTLNRF